MGERAKNQGGAYDQFREVAARESRFILRALHTHGVYARDQDDAAQEVLWVVHRRLATFDAALARQPRQAIHAWLLSICQRVAASHRRKRGRLAEDLTDQEIISSEPENVISPTEQTWLHSEDARLVWSLLDEIPEERAAVVRAYDLEEVPMSAVAAALGIPINTGWSRRRLGLRDLRAVLARLNAVELRTLKYAGHDDSPSSIGSCPRRPSK